VRQASQNPILSEIITWFPCIVFLCCDFLSQSLLLPEEIDVYMAGLDSIEDMDKPPIGARSNPWAKLKTIKQASQKELLSENMG